MKSPQMRLTQWLVTMLFERIDDAVQWMRERSAMKCNDSGQDRSPEVASVRGDLQKP